jgi:prophage DNA circulation protein
MSWRDQYQPGSFRGVAFATRGHSREGGRRGETHEFPERDQPWFEDLGRKAGRYSVDAIITGADYFGDRDALVDALDKKGPGELVHPYFGTLTVAVESWQLSESTDEGGMASFSIEFTEAGAIIAAEAGADTSSIAAGTADRVLADAPAAFASRFSVAGVPAFVEDAGAGLARSFASAASELAVLSQPAGSLLHGFQAALGVISGSAVDLVRSPLQLANAIVLAVRSFSNLSFAPSLRLAALRGLLASSSSPAPVIGATPVRQRQRDNQVAFVDLVTAIVGAEIVRAAAEADFSSYDEAAAARDGAAEQLDDLALVAADAGRDEQADTLDALRRVLVRDVTARGGSLARLFDYVPAATEPSIVIAQRLYGDPDLVIERSAEIVARNRIPHPGFVTGGITLEVRTDG